MSEPLLVATDVLRTYDVRGQAVLALRATSLTVRAGDVLAVTGPSGTGKSTLVSILAARAMLSSTVRLVGRSATTAWPRTS